MEAARHSVGTREGATAARLEIRMLLEDYESRNHRLQEVMTLIEELVKQIPMAEKLMAVAAKLIRVFYAMLTKGVEYDPVKRKNPSLRWMCFWIAAAPSQPGSPRWLYRDLLSARLSAPWEFPIVWYYEGR